MTDDGKAADASVDVKTPLPYADEDVLVFLDWGDDEDFILQIEDPGARRGPKSRLPWILALLPLLLGGGAFALWWFVLRG